MNDVEPRNDSWLRRNWFWAVPLGCLTPIVVVGGCVAAIFLVIEGSLKCSDVYAFSKEAVLANGKVRAALGEPLVPDRLVSGKISVSTEGGHADITYGVSGPKGTATVHAVGDKKADRWVLATNHVVIGPTAEELDILVSP